MHWDPCPAAGKHSPLFLTTWPVPSLFIQICLLLHREVWWTKLSEMNTQTHLFSQLGKHNINNADMLFQDQIQDCCCFSICCSNIFNPGGLTPRLSKLLEPKDGLGAINTLLPCHLAQYQSCWPLCILPTLMDVPWFPVLLSFLRRYTSVQAKQNKTTWEWDSLGKVFMSGPTWILDTLISSCVTPIVALNVHLLSHIS